MSTTLFKSAPGWALAHYAMNYESISDAETYLADATRGSVFAYKADGSAEPARIKLSAEAAGFSLGAHMTPACARKLAAALIEAADVCEQFEKQQAEVV